ncbi:thioesterase family protein [Hyphomonas neptunium ATCC 15444]|uniref:Thioesterase family protein n=2 Tax=Hyphomonas TaxID=85 RepID=Q0C0Z4_HYPNA|nr:MULTISPECIES: PaaI family thioesterase [Hyphomonas]ABI77948.1 thioesterase family protein [Hyphomonas neptunium ATCC 15444]KCZ94986.1 thioesterase family protein [Hyphomonas hirschiana VP5]
MESSTPEGFQPHFRKSGLTDPWEPLYSRNTGEAIYLGLIATPAHANSRGLVHGALMTALADNAMGLSCALKANPAGGLVTVNLAMDFLASARMGQWLEIRPIVLKAGSSMAFASATIHADDQLCARANATFRLASPRAA